MYSEHDIDLAMQIHGCTRQEAIDVYSAMIAAARAAQAKVCTPAMATAKCAAHIESHYPIYRQLNIMRCGEPKEIARMGAFIDACRAWSNSDSPDPAALAAIVP